MRYIFFSKMVKALDIDQLIQTLHEVGAEGVDLAVRPGYPVNPENAREALPKAADRIRAAGLHVPMITAATDLTNPAVPVAESLFAACHDAKVDHIKLGYWSWKPGVGYWKQNDAARRDIEGFAKLASRYGVKACLHTHSGNCLGLNASSVMHLARGFDPTDIGVYLDPGHLNLCGEPLSMAFDIAAEYLSLVAIKDSLWVRGADGQAKSARFVPMGEGMVDWREMLRALMARDFAGPLSFHSEYDGWPIDRIIEQTKRDVAYLRGLEKGVSPDA